jgi:excisionase family DNA binding protein
MERTLTSADLQRVLRVSQPVVYRILTNGELKGQKVGKQWRCDPQEVRTYLRGGGGGGHRSKPAKQDA